MLFCPICLAAKKLNLEKGIEVEQGETKDRGSETFKFLTLLFFVDIITGIYNKI